MVLRGYSANNIVPALGFTFLFRFYRPKIGKLWVRRLTHKCDDPLPLCTVCISTYTSSPLQKILAKKMILWYNKFVSDIVPLADRYHFYEKSLMFKALSSFLFVLTAIDAASYETPHSCAIWLAVIPCVNWGDIKNAPAKTFACHSGLT